MKDAIGATVELKVSHKLARCSFTPHTLTALPMS